MSVNKTPPLFVFATHQVLPWKLQSPNHQLVQMNTLDMFYFLRLHKAHPYKAIFVHLEIHKIVPDWLERCRHHCPNFQQLFWEYYKLLEFKVNRDGSWSIAITYASRIVYFVNNLYPELRFVMCVKSHYCKGFPKCLISV